MTDLHVSALLPGWNAVMTPAALAVGALALLVALAALRRERRMSRRYEAFMTGARGSDLAAAMDHLASRAADAEGRLTACERRGQAMDDRLFRALMHVAVLRYSAYSDSGGDQSFAVALLDDNGDGVVLSSLVSRSGARVFAKPVAGGHSSHPLTAEEETVIARARAAPTSG